MKVGVHTPDLECLGISTFVAWHIRQPPESPFFKGDLKNSPLKKGTRGLFMPDICCISKKVAEGLIYWSRRIMETFSQFAIVTPFNQRRSLWQVSLFLRYQFIGIHKTELDSKRSKIHNYGSQKHMFGEIKTSSSGINTQII